MRHIDLDQALHEVGKSAEGAAALKTVWNAHKTFAGRDAGGRERYYKNKRHVKWSPLKVVLLNRLGNKCWYTEAKVIGAPLTIDHFRPQTKYWFLIFDSSNYRVACPFVNSDMINPLYGCAGGKGDAFPLLDERTRATGKNAIRAERPLLLDPCDPNDCKLVAFQADGRPKLNPKFNGDQIAAKRVKSSLLGLNLDHPAFNTEREQLYFDIRDKVDEYNDGSTSQRTRDRIILELKGMIDGAAPFSAAARQYIAMFRDSAWVDALIRN